jgi:hypothetical protein
MTDISNSIAIGNSSQTSSSSSAAAISSIQNKDVHHHPPHHVVVGGIGGIGGIGGSGGGGHQDAKDMVHAIASLVHFCTDINIGTAAKSGYFMKAMICNLQYIHQQQLYERIFGDSSSEGGYVNWTTAENLHKRSMSKRKCNPIGGVAVWNNLFVFMAADLAKFREQPTSSKQLHRPFYHVYDACVREFESTALKLEFVVVVRIFFMINLIGIQAVHAIPVILGGNNNNNNNNHNNNHNNSLPGNHAQQQQLQHRIMMHAQNLTIQILGERFTPEQYADTMAWLIKTRIVAVHEDALQREVDFHKESERDQKDIMKVKVMEFCKTLRPSLIQIAKTRTTLKYGKAASSASFSSSSIFHGHHHENSSHENSINGNSNNNNNSFASQNMGQNSFEGFYTFHGFSSAMRFPPSFSPHMQKRAYWLASQVAFQWQQYVPDFLPKDLAVGLLKYGSIATPEEQILYEAIISTSITGAPFHALKEFQRECLLSFPNIERVALTMNDIFRLYVASYQPKHLWKSIWKMIRPILSIQIIKDVEKYTSSHPMDHASTVSVLLYGSSNPPPGATLRGVRVSSSSSFSLFSSLSDPTTTSSSSSVLPKTLSVAKRGKSAAASAGSNNNNGSGGGSGSGGGVCVGGGGGDIGTEEKEEEVKEEEEVGSEKEEEEEEEEEFMQNIVDIAGSRKSAAALAASRVQARQDRKRPQRFEVGSFLFSSSPIPTQTPTLSDQNQSGGAGGQSGAGGGQSGGGEGENAQKEDKEENEEKNNAAQKSIPGMLLIMGDKARAEHVAPSLSPLPLPSPLPPPLPPPAGDDASSDGNDASSNGNEEDGNEEDIDGNAEEEEEYIEDD